MSIKYYPVMSQVNADDKRDEIAQRFLSDIQNILGQPLESVPIEELAKEDLQFIFVKSGGAESYFLEAYRHISDKPVYILSTGYGNSLAASMEILSYLQQRGKAGEILHGSSEAVARRLDALFRASAAKKKLTGARFGCIGMPSDWLIASAPDETALRRQLDAYLIQIPMEELYAEIEKKSYPASRWTDALHAVGYDKDELEKALYVYGAFRRLAEQYKLHGVTVRCFDLLSTVRTTGCLGLAVLNAEGIYGGCEGDIPSLISMAILGDVSGKPVFLCNPSRMEPEQDTMVFAHCTLPMNMPYRFGLTTHYESGIGVAIQGAIPEGGMTIFKTSADLSRYYVSKGEILENLTEDSLCRSQIRIRLDDYSYFTTAPINNHHIICSGDHTDAIREFYTFLNR